MGNSKSLMHGFIHNVNCVLISANNCAFLPSRVPKTLKQISNMVSTYSMRV